MWAVPAMLVVLVGALLKENRTVSNFTYQRVFTKKKSPSEYLVFIYALDSHSVPYSGKPELC